MGKTQRAESRLKSIKMIHIVSDESDTKISTVCKITQTCFSKAVGVGLTPLSQDRKSIRDCRGNLYKRDRHREKVTDSWRVPGRK